MEEQMIDHGTGAAAAVNAPATTTLYDDEGRALTIPAGDVGVWLARGFRRQARDAKAALKDLPALWKAAHEALKDAASAIDSDGALDTAETAAYATAIVGLRELNAGIAAVLDGLHAAPVKQGED